MQLKGDRISPCHHQMRFIRHLDKVSPNDNYYGILAIPGA